MRDTRCSQAGRQARKFLTALAMATCAGTVPMPAHGQAAPAPAVAPRLDMPAPATPLQQRLQKYFPALYAQATAEFGWRAWHEGTWQALPQELPTRLVVLVHGLDEPGKLWRSLAPALAEKGYAACELRYPNDQPPRASAAFLLQALAELQVHGTREVIIVAHSMGGLVSREMLTNPDFDYAGWRQEGLVPTVQHLIMLGTPNHGSQLARGRFFVEIRDQWLRLANGDGHLLSGLVDGTGEAGKDLLPDSPFLRELNARPLPKTVALTIIAGVASPVTKATVDQLATEAKAEPDSVKRQALEKLQAGVAQVADGVGDGCVPVKSAQLDGVTDFVTVPGTHLSMIRNVLAGSERIPPGVPLVLERLGRRWPQPAKADNQDTRADSRNDGGKPGVTAPAAP